MFALEQDMDIGGTFLLGYIKLAPGELMRVFGNPQPGDMYKVTGEYAFEGPDGSRFTLYDWKYGRNVWSRHDMAPLELNIGGDDHSRQYLGDFQEWLKKQTGC